MIQNDGIQRKSLFIVTVITEQKLNIRSKCKFVCVAIIKQLMSNFQSIVTVLEEIIYRKYLSTKHILTAMGSSEIRLIL